MGNKDQKRQKKLAKKSAKRKVRIKTLQVQEQLPSFKQVADWPLHECVINSSWEGPMELSQIFISRKQEHSPHIASALFLVDLACLGVKNASSKVFTSESAYRGQLLNKVTEYENFETCSVELAAKIIRTGIEYADKLGFHPHKDFALASIVINHVDSSHISKEVPTGGEDGRPFYINGPYEDPGRVMRILNQSVGEGNYTFLLGSDDDDEEDLYFDDSKEYDDFDV